MSIIDLVGRPTRLKGLYSHIIMKMGEVRQLAHFSVKRVILQAGLAINVGPAIMSLPFSLALSIMRTWCFPEKQYCRIANCACQIIIVTPCCDELKYIFSVLWVRIISTSE